jgi:hypothetical protein
VRGETYFIYCFKIVKLLIFYRVEMLGDSLLKLAVSEHVYLLHAEMAVKDGLSSVKDSIICNKYLSEVAQSTGLGKYLRAAPLCGPLGVRSHFIPPGFPVVANGRPDEFTPCQFVSLTVHFKKLADLVEAVIGACLLSGGVRGGLNVMCALGLLPRDGRYVSVGCCVTDAPPLQLQSDITSIQLIELERVLRHSFRSTALLNEALTLRVPGRRRAGFHCGKDTVPRATEPD